MILITSTCESLLYFTDSFLLFHFAKKKKGVAAGLFFCVVLGFPISTAGLHVPVV